MTAEETFLDRAFDKSLQLAFSPVLVQLMRTLLEPTPSFTAIAGYLAMDPMLASTVLHQANAASHSIGQRITDIQRAAVVLGTEALYRLILSLLLQKQLRPVAARQSAEIFADWRITLWGAVAAEILAARLCPAQRQNAYLAALLRDIPLLLAFCRALPPEFILRRGVVTHIGRNGFAEEESAWGSTHPGLTHDIMTYWGMPEEICSAVLTHHDFEQAGRLPPLNRALIYATRWAETAQAPDADPAGCVAFELSLAAELELNREEMESLRLACAENFAPVLAQLGVREGSVETRYYEHSLEVLQSLHFLAMDICSEDSAAVMAEALGRKLLSIWGVESWKLFLTIPGSVPRQFKRQNGAITEVVPANPLSSGQEHDQDTIHLAASGRRYGRLVVAREVLNRNSKAAPLPLFAHVLAMNFERMRRLKAETEARGLLPPNVARIDSSGMLVDAGPAFFAVLGVMPTQTPVPMAALLRRQLGGLPPGFDATLAGTATAGPWIIPVRPGGNKKALFLSLCVGGDNKQLFYMTAEELPDVAPAQAACLADPEFLQLMEKNLAAQIFLLDGDGHVVWACASGGFLLGRDIFALVRPAPDYQGEWPASLATSAAKSLEVAGTLRGPADTEIPVSLRFVPLKGTGAPCCALLLRRQP